MGIASVIIGGIGCYQYSYANNLTQEGNKIAERQNYEFERQNDLDCVEQGLMSKEQYCAKYSTNCGDYFKVL